MDFKIKVSKEKIIVEKNKRVRYPFNPENYLPWDQGSAEQFVVNKLEAEKLRIQEIINKLEEEKYYQSDTESDGSITQIPAN